MILESTPKTFYFDEHILFQTTPKAFANLSPGFERSENPGTKPRFHSNPERVRQLPNPFRVDAPIFNRIPRLSLRSNPGLKLANAFGVQIAFCPRNAAVKEALRRREIGTRTPLANTAIDAPARVRVSSRTPSRRTRARRCARMKPFF